LQIVIPLILHINTDPESEGGKKEKKEERGKKLKTKAPLRKGHFEQLMHLVNFLERYSPCSCIVFELKCAWLFRFLLCLKYSALCFLA
jgi:hypothetical protein